MPLSPHEEDLSAQQEALTSANQALQQALQALAGEAKAQGRLAGRDRPVDLTLFFGMVNDVRRAEESVDSATLDLRTASGEDA